MRIRVLVVSLAVVASLTTACQSTPEVAKSGPSVSASASATPSPSSSVSAARLMISPDNGQRRVRLDKPIRVSAENGRLVDVTVKDGDGKKVKGSVSPDGAGWSSKGALRADTKYTVTATAVDGGGLSKSSKTKFTTVRPDDTVSAYVVPGEGWKVGVGMPVIIDFTESVSVKRRAAVERALTVTSTPAVKGGWRWFSSSQVQWRPVKYWPTGTKVTVTTDLRGVEVAKGIWGEKKRTTSFSIGSAMISTVSITKHTLTVRRDGKVLRVIPVTTGKAGAKYTTRSGVKVIMNRESVRRMDAETTGVSKDDPEYYDLKVKYAMRLTYSGEFLHAAPWSVAAQGHSNVSHGCTGMSTANAKWLFEHSKVGDVVKYSGSNRPIEWGNGYTAWDMSFSRWTSGA